MDPNDLRINQSSLKLARVGKEGVPEVFFLRAVQSGLPMVASVNMPDGSIGGN